MSEPQPFAPQPSRLTANGELRKPRYKLVEFVRRDACDPRLYPGQTIGIRADLNRGALLGLVSHRGWFRVNVTRRQQPAKATTHG